MTKKPKFQAIYDCILCKKKNIPHYEIADKKLSICRDCQKKKRVITIDDVWGQVNHAQEKR